VFGHDVGEGRLRGEDVLLGVPLLARLLDDLLHAPDLAEGGIDDGLRRSHFSPFRYSLATLPRNL
jgi:hypothetical protein